MRFRGLACFLLAAISVGLACTGPGGGGSVDDGTPSPSPSISPTESPTGSPTPSGLGGGLVLLTRILYPASSTLPDLRTAYAEFPVPLSPVTLVDPGVDACVFTTPTPQPSPTATPLRNAGPYLYLEGPVDEALVNPFSLNVYYSQPDPEVFADGATYDVSWDGSDATNGIPAGFFPGALVFPAQVAVTAPNLDVTTHLGGDLPVTWTAGADPLVVMTLRVNFTDPTSGAMVARIRCAPVDDGDFTIPQSFIDQMPDGSGTLVLERRRSGAELLFDGSTIYFEGISQHMGDAAKP